MARYSERSEVIDRLLEVVALGGLTFTALVAPNAVQAFDKPLQRYFKKLDQRAQQRELQHIAHYMRRNKLITDHYEHGLRLTDKARQRLQQRALETLSIPPQKVWDKKWRIIFYDIPERYKTGRDALTSNLKGLGCYQLQRSVWVHPLPCKEVVETIAATYDLDRYITYIETDYISNQTALIKKFPEYRL